MANPEHSEYSGKQRGGGGGGDSSGIRFDFEEHKLSGFGLRRK